MTSIMLYTRRPNCQQKVSYALSFYVSADFLFTNSRSWKARSSHRSISLHEICTKELQVLRSQYWCKEIK